MYPPLPLYALLALASLALSASSVRVAHGVIYIQEFVNISKMEQHLSLWAQEMGHSADRTDRLIAARTMREFLTLKSSLLLHHAVPLTVDTVDEKQVNAVRRTKRNIIGDFLHYVGGVATEDQLKQQLRIDNEIRDKITNALTRQLSFEKTITGVYANLTAEEDTLHRKIDTLHLQMKRDRALQGKIMALLQVALTDIQDLEDTLEVLWTGLPNFRHSARLAAQAALSFTPHLTLVNFTHQTSGIRILYQAYLYKEIDARTTDCNTYLVVATDEHSYALHPGHLPSLPITDRDRKTEFLSLSLRYPHKKPDIII